MESVAYYRPETGPVRLTREEVASVLDNPNHTPRDTRELFEREFKALYNSSAGTIEGYLLGDHTYMVLLQYHRYLKNTPLPSPLTQQYFETLLALHDIGKPQAVAEGDVELQHERTMPIVESFLRRVGYDEQHVAIARSLIHGDPIRLFLYKKTSNISDIALDIRQRAERAGMAAEDFWQVLHMYWMADAGSYTVDAGGKASLDRMFEFDRKAGVMHMAQHIEERIELLKAAVSGQG